MADNLFVRLFGSRNQRIVRRMRGLVVAVNALEGDFSVKDANARLWPQTERLKAEARRKGAASDSAARARAALGRHLEGVRPGLWVERMDAGGKAGADPAPATSLYHLTAALTDHAVLALVG